MVSIAIYDICRMVFDGDVKSIEHILHKCKLPNVWMAMALAVIIDSNDIIELFVNMKSSCKIVRTMDSPIAMCAFHNDVDMIKLYIIGGYDVNAVNINGNMPLMIAIDKSLEPIIDLLIREGAHPGVAGSDGKLAIHHAACANLDTFKKIYNMDTDCLNAKNDYGMCPVHFSAKSGTFEILEFIISIGIDINELTIDGWSPLTYASRHGHLKTSNVLINAGANTRTSDLNGWTPLHHAARQNHTSICINLVKCGSSPYSKIKNGVNAMELMTKEFDDTMIDNIKMEFTQYNSRLSTFKNFTT